jgi:hypothetical protein
MGKLSDAPSEGKKQFFTHAFSSCSSSCSRQQQTTRYNDKPFTCYCSAASEAFLLLLLLLLLLPVRLLVVHQKSFLQCNIV